MLNMVNDVITTVKKRIVKIDEEQASMRKAFYDFLSNPLDISYALLFSLSFSNWKRQYGDIDESMPINEPEDIMLMRKVDGVKSMLRRFRRDISPVAWNELIAMA